MNPTEDMIQRFLKETEHRMRIACERGRVAVNAGDYVEAIARKHERRNFRAMALVLRDACAGSTATCGLQDMIETAVLEWDKLTPTP
jgi:hypothetical protein